MKFPWRKDFCVWLVSPKDGTVRKVRFTARRALLCLLVAALSTAAILGMAGDYVRIQVSRAQGFFQQQQLTRERNLLHASNRSLSAKLSDMESENQRVQRYERDLRERLDELAAVLQAAQYAGVVDREAVEALGKAASGKSSTDGVGGGADLDCGDLELCQSGLDNWENGAAAAVFTVERPLEAEGSEDVVQMLDGYIKLLREVPISVPLKGKISSRFGMRRSPFSRRWQMHAGLDIAAKHGTPFSAPADGVVQKVAYDKYYGNLIEVKHNERIRTRYGHLAKALVKKGDVVVRGQKIGMIGSTGRSTGPHLHYEVWVEGKAKNPERLFELGRALARLLI